MNGKTHLPKQFRINDYYIHQVMGEGDFGVIYYADTFNADHPVAIKEYFPYPSATREPRTYRVYPAGDGSAFTEGLNAFQEEARQLAALNHEGIAERFDFFEANGTAYTIMDLKYTRGSSLADWLKANHVSNEQRVFQMMNPVFEALKYLQPFRETEAFSTRDVTPSNIMLTEREGEFRATLLDNSAVRRFLADATELYPQLSADNYAAPEQVDEGNKGAFTDVYSCGALIYHLVGGKQPPTAHERQEIVRLNNWQTHDIALTNSTLNFSAFSPPLAQVVSSALALDSFKRYQSIDDFIHACKLALNMGYGPLRTDAKEQLLPPHLLATGHQNRSQEESRFNQETQKPSRLKTWWRIAALSFITIVSLSLVWMQFQKNKAAPSLTQNPLLENAPLNVSPQVIPLVITPNVTVNNATPENTGSPATPKQLEFVQIELPVVEVVTTPVVTSPVVTSVSVLPDVVLSEAQIIPEPLYGVRTTDAVSVLAQPGLAVEFQDSSSTVDMAPLTSLDILDWQTLTAAFTSAETLNANQLAFLFSQLPSKQLSTGKTFSDLSLSPDGKFLAATNAQEGLVLWNLNAAPNAAIFPEATQTGSLTQLAFSPISTASEYTILTATRESKLTVWQLSLLENNALELRASFELSAAKHSAPIRSISFNATGDLLATADTLGTIFLWDTRTNKLLHTFSHDTLAINDLEFSADGKFLASGSSNGSIVLWDLLSAEPVSRFETSGSIESMAFKPDGSGLLAAYRGQDNSGKLELWSLLTQTPQRLDSDQNAFSTLALSNELFLLGNGEGDLSFIAPQTNQSMPKQQGRLSQLELFRGQDELRLVANYRGDRVLFWSLPLSQVEQLSQSCELGLTQSGIQAALNAVCSEGR